MDMFIRRSGDPSTDCHKQAHWQKSPNNKPRTTWIFWSPPQSRIMATHHPPNFIFSGGRQFWSKIHRQIRHWPPHFRIEKTLWDIWRLYRGAILRHHTKVSLLQLNTETLYIYFPCQATSPNNWKTPTRDIKTTATCTTSLSTKEIQRGGTRTNQNRRLKTSRPRWKIPRTENISKHCLLCNICLPHNPHDTINIGEKKSKATAQTINNLYQQLDYLGIQPYATIRYYASGMIQNVHSDTYYLSDRDAKIWAAVNFFLIWKPQDKEPIHINGEIFTLCHKIKKFAASASEAELGALFLNAKESKIGRLALRELLHPQPHTPIHCDKSTATGIGNGTVKRQISRSTKMRYFYIRDIVKHKEV